MSEISSGLVAVAWSVLNGEHTPLVRLSDAEAIIAQKDAEILEQCRINGMGAERELALRGQMERQDERIKELEATVAGFRLDQEEMIAEEVRQSVALKLAREALGKLSLYVAHNGDDWVKRNATEALAAIDALKGE